MFAEEKWPSCLTYEACGENPEPTTRNFMSLVGRNALKTGAKDLVLPKIRKKWLYMGMKKL